ncbi:thylakoid membrane protein TERC, chloroplastic-like [Phragmites australis]|uniref:thylakoid membrane protein TERC, chloroplastic-like n=1 Tax=Phragmites australis TaxID=29695 RepID=UPI002D76EFBD|nr:thylakoid membrane protein TERC, chloroplastic-like [Phragmites australis]XP_062230595.1 thylakoid membrane protein TERC, chloroplastic-like [Phragmites australis]
MASAVAASTATRFLPQLSAPWLRRARVALSPSPPLPWRPLAAIVTTSSRRPAEGEGGRRGRKRSRARGTDQEDRLDLSSEMETTNSTPHGQTNKGTKPVPESSVTGKGSAIRRVTLVVLAAVLFGVSIALRDGAEKASEYFAGYLLEQSLSVDNLFVFVLVFKYFKVPKEYQNRVLSYGIAGAVIFRAVMIILGVASIQRFEAVNLLLALILLFTSYKLFAEEEDESDLSDNFIVKACQKFIPVTDYYDDDRFFTNQDGLWKATPLLLTLAVIELSDIAFAIDSIPAVFGVTRDPLIILSSNIFAISGLRSLYVLISESMAELEYLQPAIGIVLGFIGTKMISDFFGYHLPTEASLAIVTTCLSGGVILSLRKASKEEKDK